MSQPQQQPAQKQLEQPKAEPVVVARFRSALLSFGSLESATNDTSGMAAQHKGLEIQPARMTGAGIVVCAKDEAATGLRIAKSTIDNSVKPPVKRTVVAFVPWANVAEYSVRE